MSKKNKTNNTKTVTAVYGISLAFGYFYVVNVIFSGPYNELVLYGVPLVMAIAVVAKIVHANGYKLRGFSTIENVAVAGWLVTLMFNFSSIIGCEWGCGNFGIFATVSLFVSALVTYVVSLQAIAGTKSEKIAQKPHVVKKDWFNDSPYRRPVISLGCTGAAIGLSQMAGTWSGYTEALRPTEQQESAYQILILISIVIALAGFVYSILTVSIAPWYAKIMYSLISLVNFALIGSGFFAIALMGMTF